jgi:hypothetical protein
MLVRKLCLVKLPENILCMFAEVVMRLGKHFSINLLLSCELKKIKFGALNAYG